MVPPNSDLIAQDSDKSKANLPEGRYGHVMVAYGHNILMYGGILADGKVVAELWLFDTDDERWQLLTQLDDTGAIHPPPLTYATLTRVNNWFYLFGGGMLNGKFSNQMFRIDMNARRWEKVRYRSNTPMFTRVVGHSTVYNPMRHSLLVYGGIHVDIARFSKLSEHILEFDLTHRTWSILMYPPRVMSPPSYSGSAKSNKNSSVTYTPLERAFHTATVAGDYMVVYGGYLHKHKQEEVCYDYHIYLYNMRCNTWQSRALVTDVKDRQKGLRDFPGVYGHATVLLHDRTLAIIGGFHGIVSNSILAYTLPGALVPTRHHKCSAYVFQNVCVVASDPSGHCVWCTDDKPCHSSNDKDVTCTTNLQTTPCPGICPLLSTCTSCALAGCLWCPLTRSCLTSSASSCKQEKQSESIERRVGDFTPVSHPEECGRSTGLGLVYAFYRPPVNSSHPDIVGISNGSVLSLFLKDEFTGEREALQRISMLGTGSKSWQLDGSSEEAATLTGFLLPAQDTEGVYVKLRAEHQNASLTIEGEDTVIEVNAADDPVRTSERRIKLRGSIYRAKIKSFSKGTVSLLKTPVYHAGLDISILMNEGELRIDRGEGYLCPTRVTCLSCVMDAACGWCNGEAKCIDNTQTCNDESFHVLTPSDCETCTQHIYCAECVTDMNCEWLSEAAHCTRRGRFPQATEKEVSSLVREVTSVREIDQCPSECSDRNTCVDCLGKEGRCAWCQETRECFLFSVYTSTYQYGRCRSWLDEDHTNASLIAAARSRQFESDPQTGECQPCSMWQTCKGL